MKNIDFTIIKNIPEKISGQGILGYSLGLLLYVVLFLFELPCMLIDQSWLKDTVDIIIQSGFFVITGCAIIFIFFPLYYLIRLIMETIRTIRNRRAFYTTPNILYIKLNENDVFFKNTIGANDFSLRKSDINKVLLSGTITTQTAPGRSGGRKITYVKDLELNIETTYDKYTIFPPIYSNKTIDQQIRFYESYFNDFYPLFKSEGPTSQDQLESLKVSYELETGEKEEPTTSDHVFKYFDIIINCIVILAFLYYIIQVILILK